MSTNQSLSTASSLFLLHAEFHRSKLALANQSVTLDPSPGPLVSVLACGIQYTTCFVTLFAIDCRLYHFYHINKNTLKVGSNVTYTVAV